MRSLTMYYIQLHALRALQKETTTATHWVGQWLGQWLFEHSSEQKMPALPGNRTLIVQPLAVPAFETTRLKRDTQAIINTSQMDVFRYCFVTAPRSVQARAPLFTTSRRYFRHDRHHNTWPFILPPVHSSYNEIAIGRSDLRISDSPNIRKWPRNANSDRFRYTMLLA